MIFLASDHGGYQLKEKIRHRLAINGISFEDYGTFSDQNVDYPKYAKQVARSVVKTNGKGILFCRSGQGMAIAANRFPGVRAVVVWTQEIADEARRDNDANILSLPADFLDENQAWEIVAHFLTTPFTGYERHKRRISQIERGG